MSDAVHLIQLLKSDGFSKLLEDASYSATLYLVEHDIVVQYV